MSTIRGEEKLQVEIGGRKSRYLCRICNMGLHKVSSLLSVLLVTNDCKESCLISDSFLFFAAHHRTSSNCCHSTSFFSELPGEHFEISDDEDWSTEGRGDII